MDRRIFLKTGLLGLLGYYVKFPAFAKIQDSGYIMTVNGKLSTKDLGTTLSHEHVLVDFKKGISGEIWWDQLEVTKVVLPYLLELKEQGCQTIFEFTPSFIGKDVKLLKKLAEASGLQIVTNTGYYGARNNKFMPSHAFHESASDLASRWIKDFEQGVQGTDIRPGFIKTAVNPGPLTQFHQKLIKAAALTHLSTGLTIASHTGPAQPALEQIEILKKNGVHPRAFIWTHAQNEEDLSNHIKVASMGAWVSLDNVNKQNISKYLTMVSNLQTHGYLNQLLVSHDAGWYTPGEENGGSFRRYTDIFTHLLPALKNQGFTAAEIDQVLAKNPARAFSISVKKY